MVSRSGQSIPRSICQWVRSRSQISLQWKLNSGFCWQCQLYRRYVIILVAFAKPLRYVYAPLAVDGTFSLVFGTSASSPVVGSLITLVNDARIAAGKGPVGFINPSVCLLCFFM